MFALYFLAMSIGGAISGIFAQLYNEENEAPYFATLGIATLVLGVVMLAITPMTLKLMKGVR